MSHARLLIALGLGLTAGAVHAEAAGGTSALSLTRPEGGRPLDLSAPGLPVLYSRAPARLPAGVARTSVERRASDVTGSAGLLCGLQPSADTSGAATARGYDPDGKFIGAKLALRF
ncbi:hypothetical protein [Caulobacter sp. LARHSG274]